ncbi:MAG: M3 family oligoendopeptidase [Phycisphaerales bacterium]|nr:M3 family oligoendopeptidase [Phycisphaerales bacterium]
MGDQLTYPRRFLSHGASLDSWGTIEPYFDRLRDRSIGTPKELERWLLDYSELCAAVVEVGTDRHVKMTCQTDDPARKAAFIDFIENIDPPFKVRCHELDVRYTQSPAARDLPRQRYFVLDRAVRAGVELFRDENVPLQTDEAKLEQQYQEVSGAQTVVFDGQERTLQQLAPYAERTDRAVRQAAWEAETTRRLADKDNLDDVFDQLIALRHRMAQNAGCLDYREYAFKAKLRFDYTPQDCLAFHQAIERAVVPAMRELQRERKAALSVEPLRPWDLAVDVRGRPPLKPFETPSELCAKASRVFHRVDPALGADFDEMARYGYFDLESRKGKAPGGYQATYEEARHPFIFMNAVGVQRDVRTLLHEGGHAFHCVAARNDPLLAYRSSPIEFAEVASMGMEMLALDVFDEFYRGDDLARAKRAQLEGVIALFPWVATIDAFQHWLYTNPQHSREERREQWLELNERFGGIADYAGYEEALAWAWQRQLHLYEVPFYYVEYGIAKLGALQVWRNAMTDRSKATRMYRQALALGGSRPLPELFAAAGARFDFSHETLAPLVGLIQRELAMLPV